MAPALDALPTNPADLRAYGVQLVAILGEQGQLIGKRTHQLARFRHYLYGRRSEPLDPAQPLLEFASWVPAQASAAAAPTPAAPAPAPRRGHGRTPRPALLPRRQVEHVLPPERCTGTACGTPLVKIGEETNEPLDYQPACRHVVEHVRFTSACRVGEDAVVTAPLPAAPSTRGARGQGASPR